MATGVYRTDPRWLEPVKLADGDCLHARGNMGINVKELEQHLIRREGKHRRTFQKSTQLLFVSVNRRLLCSVCWEHTQDVTFPPG